MIGFILVALLLLILGIIIGNYEPTTYEVKASGKYEISEECQRQYEAAFNSLFEEE